MTECEYDILVEASVNYGIKLNLRLNAIVRKVLNETDATITTNRLWEATACGAMLLTERAAGIDLAFKLGQEVVCYEDKKDLVEKVTFYLNNEDIRRKIALSGQNRCKKDHTVSNRLKRIIEVCR